MSKKKFTVAILGVGSRGGNVYGTLLNSRPDEFDIVALCDPRQERLDMFSAEFNVDKANCFRDENEFFKCRRADLLVIATLDRDHVRQCLTAFELGYDVLCEKPLSDKIEECEALLESQKRNGNKILVCHVLRYASAFLKLADIIDSGEIGRLVSINSLERVRYWHQAHSYVRGNWRRSEETTPMILAKCCHDLDLIQYYANSRCKTVSSVGSLSYFNKENMPEGARERCTECKYIDTCPYSAKDIYIDIWKKDGSRPNVWPENVIAPAPLTDEKLMKAIKEGPYGRCVFACDNNVVDHQHTQMEFENGVKASLTMVAFTGQHGRRMDFFGTLGELVFDGDTNVITLYKFGKEPKTISVSELEDGGFGHGGGDVGLISDLYDVLMGKGENRTSLEASIESHLIGIKAEESRLRGGVCLSVHGD